MPRLSSSSADDESLRAGYRRLAEIDPPAMRSLAADLLRAAREASAIAAQQHTPASDAGASRSARHADAAKAALDALERPA